MFSLVKTLVFVLFGIATVNSGYSFVQVGCQPSLNDSLDDDSGNGCLVTETSLGRSSLSVCETPLSTFPLVFADNQGYKDSTKDTGYLELRNWGETDYMTNSEAGIKCRNTDWSSGYHATRSVHLRHIFTNDDGFSIWNTCKNDVSAEFIHEDGYVIRENLSDLSKHVRACVQVDNGRIIHPYSSNRG